MPSPKSLTKSVIKNWSWLCWRNAFAHLVNFCKREKKQTIRLPLTTKTKEAGEAQLQSMETETDLIRFWNNSIVKIAQQISNFNTNIIIWVRYGKSSIKELSQPTSLFSNGNWISFPLEIEPFSHDNKTIFTSRWFPNFCHTSLNWKS